MHVSQVWVHLLDKTPKSLRVIGYKFIHKSYLIQPELLLPGFEVSQPVILVPCGFQVYPDAVPLPDRRRPDVDRRSGEGLAPDHVPDPVQRMRDVRDLDDCRAPWPQDPVHLGNLARGIRQVVQYPHHRDEVDALVREVQGGRVHQPLFDLWMFGKEARCERELLTAGIHQRDLVGELAQHHAEAAVATADIGGLPETAAFQEPPDRQDLGLVLVVPI